MPYANTPTLLDLNRCARIVGFDPLHFSQGFSTVRPEPSCSDVWMQYNWQDPDKVSRDHLKFLVANATRDVADALGYWPAPVWIVDERHQYPRLQRRELYGGGANVRGRWKSLQTNRGYVLYGGQRATMLLSEETWVGIDPDGDGFDELAEFQLTVDADLNPCEAHAYFKLYTPLDAANTRTDPSSTGADESWEVDIVGTSLTGTTLTVWVHSWDLLRPQLKEALDAGPIDADVPANYVDELVFYRVYNDPQTQVEFQWGDDISCSATACAAVCQVGCLRVKEARNGIVVPQPSTYEDGVFTAASWSQGVEADFVRLWYKAGLSDSRDALGCTRLDDYWAKTIAILATSRTDWPICTCDNNLGLLTDFWRTEVSKITKEKSFIVTQRELGNPFGTRIGEIIAWRRVSGRGRRKGQTLNV